MLGPSRGGLTEAAHAAALVARSDVGHARPPRQGRKPGDRPRDFGRRCGDGALDWRHHQDRPVASGIVVAGNERPAVAETLFQLLPGREVERHGYIPRGGANRQSTRPVSKLPACWQTWKSPSGDGFTR